MGFLNKIASFGNKVLNRVGSFGANAVQKIGQFGVPIYDAINRASDGLIGKTLTNLPTVGPIFSKIGEQFGNLNKEQNATAKAQKALAPG
jgi:hypothetical protein